MIQLLGANEEKIKCQAFASEPLGAELQIKAVIGRIFWVFLISGDGKIRFIPIKITISLCPPQRGG